MWYILQLQFIPLSFVLCTPFAFTSSLVVMDFDHAIRKANWFRKIVVNVVNKKNYYPT